jgi:hypothetical protein
LENDPRFVHYSTGENVDTGMWGIEGSNDFSQGDGAQSRSHESLSDQVEFAVVSYLQKNPNSIYLEIEDDLYQRFAGLMTPTKAMIYAVLYSYAERQGAAWVLRAEDMAAARRSELATITAMLEIVGTRLGYVTSKEGKNYLWQHNGQTVYAFYILASALVGRAIAETPHLPEQTIIVIPGGRAALVEYKAGRDPALAARLKSYRVVKYRLLRTLVEVPVLTRETFEEQITSDPLEKSQAQMMMF